jgi:hypothetical protein
MRAWWKESSSTLWTNKGGLSVFLFSWTEFPRQGARRKQIRVLVFTSPSLRLCARTAFDCETIPNYQRKSEKSDPPFCYTLAHFFSH